MLTVEGITKIKDFVSLGHFLREGGSKDEATRLLSAGRRMIQDLGSGPMGETRD